MNTSAAHDPCTVQIRSSSGADPERVPGEFRGMQGKRLSVVTEQRVPASTVVTVEHDDCLFLGEVIASTQDVGGHWHLEMKVGQVLTGLQSLMNLRANLLGESVAASPFRREHAFSGR